MKKRKSGRTSIWYALLVLLAVLAVGYAGVKFGLERGNIRRARLASESASEETLSGVSDASFGEESVSSGPESGADSEIQSAAEVTTVSEAKRTQSILAEMSEEAKGEDSSRLRGVITACVPDVVSWAAENKKVKRKSR